MSVCRPLAMASQPWAWASVGASKLDRNQSRIAGEKRSRGSAATVSAGTGRECTASTLFRPDVRLAIPHRGDRVRVRGSDGGIGGRGGEAGSPEQPASDVAPHLSIDRIEWIPLGDRDLRDDLLAFGQGGDVGSEHLAGKALLSPAGRDPEGEQLP